MALPEGVAQVMELSAREEVVTEPVSPWKVSSKMPRV
jgi:hypothetical protein